MVDFTPSVLDWKPFLTISGPFQGEEANLPDDALHPDLFSGKITFDIDICYNLFPPAGMNVKRHPQGTLSQSSLPSSIRMG